MPGQQGQQGQQGSARSGKDGGRRARGQKYQNQYAYKHNKSSKHTLHILSLPIGGVCKRCYDVLLWRKTYRKYKPLTKARKCNVCAKKHVKQAYCTVCKPCALDKVLCEKCGKSTAGEGRVERDKTFEEEQTEQQQLEYELRFMKERERRKVKRRMALEDDKRAMRQLAFVARKEAEAAEALAAGLDYKSGRTFEEEEADLDDWANEAQPTDLNSQQRVLVTFYAELEPTKPEEDVLAILDKRRGEDPVLEPDAWNLLCAKLKLKYRRHPLEIMAEYMDRMLELDSEGEEDYDDGSEYGDEGESEYADSLMDAMEDLGWDTETEGSQMTDVNEGSEGGSSGSEDFETPRDGGGELGAAAAAQKARVQRAAELASAEGACSVAPLTPRESN